MSEEGREREIERVQLEILRLLRALIVRVERIECLLQDSAPTYQPSGSITLVPRPALLG